MKKDIKHIFWMLLCLFTIVACSDENHEMLITPLNSRATSKVKSGIKQQPVTTCTALKVMYMFTSVSMTGCMFLRNGV